MAVFASPDFGAGGGACLILMIFGAVVFALLALVIGLTFKLISGKSVRERRAGVCLGACLAFAILGASFCWWFFHYKPRSDFQELLAGSQNRQIAALDITGQQ